MNKPRVSLRDLARMADVSHATVSLALRNQPQVAAETRERIQHLARSCGYQPDPMLRALAEYRRGKATPHYRATLAWLTYYRDPKQADIIIDFLHHRQGAEERAAELGYKLEIFAPARDRLGAAQLKKILQARGIQGILLPPLPKHGPLMDFDFSPFSVITFGHSLMAPSLDLVANDQFAASALTLKKLREMGHRRIGFVTSRPQSERTQWKFVGGYLGEQAGLPAKERLPIFLQEETDLTEEGFRKMAPWMKKYRPDAVITHFSEMIGHLNSQGTRVPEDISVAMLPAMARETWAGVDLNSKEVGRTAVDALASMLYHNERGIPAKPKRILIQAVWQDGPTVISRPAKAVS